MSARTEQGDVMRPQMPKEMKAPAWVTADYGTDAAGRRLAAWRYNQPVTSANERQLAKEFVNGETWPCSSCGLHAFNEPGRVCYWCNKFGVTRDGAGVTIDETGGKVIDLMVALKQSLAGEPVTGQPSMDTLRAAAKSTKRRKKSQ
jgi:hypothetical protein